MVALSRYVYANPPRFEKLRPQPVVLKPASIPALDGDSYLLSADLTYKRGLVEDDSKEVYLNMNGREQLITLRPALGSLRRAPERFTAVVMDSAGKSRTVEIRAGQMLTVWG